MVADAVAGPVEKEPEGTDPGAMPTPALVPEADALALEPELGAVDDFALESETVVAMLVEVTVTIIFGTVVEIVRTPVAA